MLLFFNFLVYSNMVIYYIGQYKYILLASQQTADLSNAIWENML